MRKTSRMKLDVTQVFSIVDIEFEQKSNNQNDQLYRLESGEITRVKETGKKQRELRYKWLKKLVGQIAENYIVITWEKPQKGQLRRIFNDHVN